MRLGVRRRSGWRHRRHPPRHEKRAIAAVKGRIGMGAGGGLYFSTGRVSSRRHDRHAAVSGQIRWCFSFGEVGELKKNERYEKSGKIHAEKIVAWHGLCQASFARLLLQLHPKITREDEFETAFHWHIYAMSSNCAALLHIRHNGISESDFLSQVGQTDNKQTHLPTKGPFGEGLKQHRNHMCAGPAPLSSPCGSRSTKKRKILAKGKD